MRVPSADSRIRARWFCAVVAGLVLVCSSAPAEWVSIGPDGGPIQCLAVHPLDTRTLFAVASEASHTPRVYKSTDDGANWACVGRMCDSLVTSMAVDMTYMQNVYACGRDTFIYRSTDAGASWNRTMVSGFATAVAVDPYQPNFVFSAGFRRMGNVRPVVHVSSDYGETWSTVEVDTATCSAVCCAVDCDISRDVYLGGSDGRLYRSTDQGVTWELRNSGLPQTAAVLTISASTAGVLLAGTTAGLYRSTDDGLSWTLVAPESRQWKVEFAVDPDFPEMAYAIGYDFSADFYVSSDAGRTWTIPVPGMQVDRNGGVRAVPLARWRVYLYGTLGVTVSYSSGSDWDPADYGMRFAGISTIAAVPWDRSHVYAAASGNTIHRSTSGGADWTQCGSVVACGNICGLAFAPSPGIERVYALEGAG